MIESLITLFEWDEEKNKHNFFKHGIWFEEAQTLWGDAHSKDRLLLVVFCERLDPTTIRLISARKATKKEVKEYEEGI